MSNSNIRELLDLLTEGVQSNDYQENVIFEEFIEESEEAEKDAEDSNKEIDDVVDGVEEKEELNEAPEDDPFDDPEAEQEADEEESEEETSAKTVDTDGALIDPDSVGDYQKAFNLGMDKVSGAEGSSKKDAAQVYTDASKHVAPLAPEVIDSIVTKLQTMEDSPKKQSLQAQIVGQFMPLIQRYANRDSEIISELRELFLTKYIPNWDPEGKNSFLNYVNSNVRAEAAAIRNRQQDGGTSVRDGVTNKRYAKNVQNMYTELMSTGEMSREEAIKKVADKFNFTQDRVVNFLSKISDKGMFDTNPASGNEEDYDDERDGVEIDTSDSDDQFSGLEDTSSEDFENWLKGEADLERENNEMDKMIDRLENEVLMMDFNDLTPAKKAGMEKKIDIVYDLIRNGGNVTKTAENTGLTYKQVKPAVEQALTYINEKNPKLGNEFKKTLKSVASTPSKLDSLEIDQKDPTLANYRASDEDMAQFKDRAEKSIGDAIANWEAGDDTESKIRAVLQKYYQENDLVGLKNAAEKFGKFMRSPAAGTVKKLASYLGEADELTDSDSKLMENIMKNSGML